MEERAIMNQTVLVFITGFFIDEDTENVPELVIDRLRT